MLNNINGGGQKRDSNLETYRILCMLMIVAHHCVVNSGLTALDGPMTTEPSRINTIYLWLYGMWGKTGINCFLMITGYFMCCSSITLRKFVKLMLQIYLYKIVIFSIFLATGYETISLGRLVKLLMPIWNIHDNFTSCFIVFWLTIPFWNILIKNMNQKQHQILLILLLGVYTFLGSVPKFKIAFNYVTWFGIIYLIASYIRLYPCPLFERKRLWAFLSVLSVLVAMGSVYAMHLLVGKPYFFVSDSNKLFAVAVAVTTFLWFKNISLPYNKWINIVGGSTFGVLLIHANSDAMRTWLWKETVNCVGHYSLPIVNMALYFLMATLIIFTVCILIDRLRMLLIERPFFRWYDKRFQGIK